MLQLEDMTEDQFEKLKASGMLWEVFPEAPYTYLEVVRLNKKRSIIDYCSECLIAISEDHGIEYEQLCAAIYDATIDEDVPRRIKEHCITLEELLDEYREDPQG